MEVLSEEGKDDENEISLIHHTLRQAQGEHRSTSFIIQVTDFFYYLEQNDFRKRFQRKINVSTKIFNTARTDFKKIKTINQKQTLKI